MFSTIRGTRKIDKRELGGASEVTWLYVLLNTFSASSHCTYRSGALRDISNTYNVYFLSFSVLSVRIVRHANGFELGKSFDTLIDLIL